MGALEWPVLGQMVRVQLWHTNRMRGPSEQASLPDAALAESPSLFAREKAEPRPTVDQIFLLVFTRFTHRRERRR